MSPEQRAMQEAARMARRLRVPLLDKDGVVQVGWKVLLGVS